MPSLLPHDLCHGRNSSRWPLAVNPDILGISELKWMGLGGFNSDVHYIYYCGQESFRRDGVAIVVKKRVWHNWATERGGEWKDAGGQREELRPWQRS